MRIGRPRPSSPLAGTLLALGLLLAVSTGPAGAWGSVAHGILTSGAVDRVPGTLGEFLRANRVFLVCYSVLPDSWWGSPHLLDQLPPGLENPTGVNGPSEVERHYLGVDEAQYGPARLPGAALRLRPFDRRQGLAMMRRWVAVHGKAALAEFRKQFKDFKGGIRELPQAMLDKGGQVPWVIQERMDDLVAAMREGRWRRALLLATVVGHYAGDAHVPLHTAVDHNGALRSNRLVKGIHGRWEARMVERNEGALRAAVEAAPMAAPPADPGPLPEFLFGILADSYALTPELYRVEDELLGEKARVVGERKVKRDDPAIYDDAYYSELWRRLGPGLTARLARSADDLATLWWVAWERAGRPRPPSGRIATPPMKAIDFKRDLVLPYDPARGPRE